MTRHSKNCTASAVYSYHERSKDSRTSGYGTQKARLGRDSVREFDCCSLTLQPCRNPVVTPDGHLFDKEAILEYICGRKREIRRLLKEWERQQDREKDDLAAIAAAEQETKKKRFLELNDVGGSSDLSSGSSSTFSSPATSLQNSLRALKTTEEKKKQVASFWVPSLAPDNKEVKMKRPDERVRCPITDKPLRLKDLIDVHFEAIPDADRKAVAFKGSKARYRCAITGDGLSNSSSLVVLRPTGTVITEEAFQKLVRPDMRHPKTGEKLSDKDIIKLHRGASGFAASGLSLSAKKETPVLQ